MKYNRVNAGQETVCKKFPVAMNHNSVTPSRKLYAKSFLSL